MCGGPEVPYKPDSSDLVAIIHPVSSSSSPQLYAGETISSTPSSSRSTSPFHGRLRLSNRLPERTTSEFSYDDTLSGMDIQGPLNVRIHRYASSAITSTTRTSGEESLIMHSFMIDNAFSKTISTSVRMDLGVGGDGVVGRTVSILDGEQRVLGEGIIGRI